MSTVEMPVEKTMPPPEAGRDVGEHYELIIESGRAERHYWLDLWRYRELFQVLAWRDIAVRYKQTVIGAAWAIIRPFLTMVVFTIVFGKLAQLPSDGTAPYALMVFAGMLPWSFFATAVADASNSLISNANLIGKVYFPRLIVPIAAVMVAFVDFLIGFAILIGSDDLVPVRAGLAGNVFAGLCLHRLHGEHRHRGLDHRAQRQVPRLPICNSLHGSDGAVRIACRVQLERHPGSMASPLLAQPDGRGDRRVSLVPPGRRKPAVLAGLALSVGVAAFFLWFGIRQFRKMEKSFADLI